MDSFSKIFRFVFSLYGFVVFLLLMLILFPAILVFSLRGPVQGGNMIYRVCRLWADVAFFLWGFRHRNIYEGPHDNSKPFVYVFNHCSYMDIPVIMKTFREQHFRVLGKEEMKNVPVFGFLYSRAAIMVDRKSPAARANSILKMISYLKKNISVVIAPEGTFNASNKPLKDFYNGAFKIAIETQTPIKPVLFLDANDRLNQRSIFSMNPGKSRSVFLQEIPVTGLRLDDIELLKNRVYKIMEEALIRYKASWIKLS